jgi:hypothetical protein
VLGRGYSDPTKYDATLTKQIAEQEKSLRDCEQTIAGLEALSRGEASALRHEGTRLAVTDQMMRETSHAQEQLENARLGGLRDRAAEFESLKLADLSAKAVLDNHDVPDAAQLQILSAAAKAVLPLWTAERGRRSQELENHRSCVPIRKMLCRAFP